ncbi:MAG: flagellar FlbD family protein [Chloroflexi bacterium]|nr:flagellar FlbD family protein [Chloroflexota bacterium]
MILVTRLNGSKFFINAELIRTIESTPDTVITLVDDMKLVVKESPELVVERVVEYRRKVRAPFSVLDSLD